MQQEKPCCAAAAARMVKKLTLSNGFQVGILNLESIFKEVAELKLTSDDAIKKELLERVKIYNYVAPGADDDYSRALLREYKRQYGKIQVKR